MRRLVIALAVLASTWAVAALYYDVPIAWLRIPVAGLYAGVIGTMLWRTRANRTGLLVWLGSVVLVIAWWFSLSPSQDRNWLPDVAQLPWADQDGDRVTIHNVRNFVYRTETSYTQQWETRYVNLSELRGVDLFLTHFGSPLIAHATVSFQFRNAAGNDTFIAMSIEQRKTIGETYSTVRGFFRQYELIYLVSDERDVVRLRTNYRTGEEVRLYHTRMNPEDGRRLFLQYLRWIEDVRRQPRWYNALTDNCTSSVTAYLAKNKIGGWSGWDWRVLLNGKGDEMLYDHGDLETGGLSFEALAQQAVINDAAKHLGDDPNFSIDIRRGHPGF